MSIRDEIATATDTLNSLRRRYFQKDGITYEDMAAAATVLLELRRQAEKQFKGRTSIQINAVSIARLIRSS